MGAARTITSLPRTELDALRREIETAAEDQEFQPLELSRIRKRISRLSSQLSVADGRMRAIRLLTGDVSDVRNIEATCAHANVTPLIFDLEPTPLDAA